MRLPHFSQLEDAGQSARIEHFAHGVGTQFHNPRLAFAEVHVVVVQLVRRLLDPMLTEQPLMLVEEVSWF